MKYSKFPWVTAIIMAGTVEAAANDRPSQSEAMFQKAVKNDVMLLPSKPASGKFNAQFSDEGTMFLPSLKKMRVIRQPLPGRSPVVITTSPRDVIAVPNSANGKMRVIVPPNQTLLRHSIPNRSSD